MLKKHRQRKILKRILKTMEKGGCLCSFTMGAIKSDAADLVWNDKITVEFYEDIFMTGNLMKGYWETEEFMKNYVKYL